MCLCLKQLKTHNITIWISRKWYTQNKTKIHSYSINKYFWLFTNIYKQFIHYESYDESSINLMSFPLNHKFTVYLNISIITCQIIRYSFCWWINANFCSPTSIVAFQNGWAGLFWDATELQKYAWLVNIYLLF